MNMISTGAFLPETDASTKQSELVKKLTAAWEKKNSKTARAGGASLMALSLAACGGEDNTPFSQADVDAAKAEGVASVDIKSDNTDVMLAQADYDAAIETAKTSNDADIAAAAKTEALTSADGTIYATVDAAYTAGSNVTNAAAVEAALTDAAGVKHNNVDAAISSNDAAVEASATSAAEASLLSGTGWASVSSLLAAYEAATAPSGAVSLDYSTSTDLLTNLTTADDTVTGAFGSVADADVLVDVNSTDNDTANLTVADSSNLTISGIEQVNIDVRDTNTSSTVTIDKISGANDINIKSSYGSTTMAVAKAGSGQKITFDDTDFTALSVNAGGTTDSATNNVHLVLKGEYTASLNTDAANNDIDGLIIETSGGASTITLDATDDFIAATTGTIDTEYVTGRGDSNLTLVSNQAGNNGLDGAIVNNEMSGDATLTVKIDGGTLDNEQIDLSNISADKIVIADVSSGTSGDLKVASGAILETGVADVVGHATAITSATAGGSVTYNVKHADTTADNALTFTSFGTVNIVMAGASALVWDDPIATTYTGIGNSTDLNITTGAAKITMGAIAASASNTLDAVTVTGGGDLTTETIAANSLTATVEDFVASDLTIEGAVDIAASKTVTIDGLDNTAANTATLTINAGDDVTFNDGIGKDNVATDLGAVSITSTAGSISIEALDTDSNATLTAAAAGEGVTATATVTTAGNLSANAGGTANFDAIAATGTVDITAKLIDLNGATAGSTITLTATDTVNNSTFDGAITGNVIFNGDGVTYASVTNDEDISGNVTVQGGASLSMTAGTEILTGTVTHKGSGTVSIQDLAGKYVGGDATGAVDIDDTAAGATEITTGSGDDNIITGDVAAQINTGAGHDVINAASVGAGKQVIIDAGDGVDTITGGVGTTDQLTGGSGTDTFKYTAATHGSANENIKDFVVGAAGDIFHITDNAFDGAGDTLLMDGASVTKIDTSDTSTTSIDDITGALLFTGAGYADTAALLAAIDGTSGIVEASATDLDNEDAIAIYYDNSGSDAGVKIALIKGDADWSTNGAASVTVFASLDGLALADITNFTADNFVIA